jgi:tRNA pseudouridine65 synthase
VELQPVTGRFHQLRKHMAHIMHPIIGDRPHGCNKQNRLWKERFGMTAMLLMADRLSFEYPAGKQVDISCPMSQPFSEALTLLRIAAVRPPK